MRQLKIVVADDHRLMLEAIRMALEGVPDIAIVGEAQTGSQVLPLVHQTQPDVVLLDIRMPGMDGLQCLELLRKRHREVKTIMLSGCEDPQVVKAAFAHGARAFILKQIDPRDLAGAIRQTMEGTVFQANDVLGSSSAKEDTAKAFGLSERELSILAALAEGSSNKEISQRLWLSEKTVKFHLTNIYRKLDVKSRSEAIRFAYAHGMTESPLLADAPVAAA
jgi:DNA-binding NarL/FixJ family response regulator